MLIKFLKKVALLILLVIIGCSLFLFFVKPLIRSSNEYVAASIDKEKRLAALPSPKLVFVGGSNLSFGLDCERISKVFNISVVNMGLHGGLGLAFMLNETKDAIQKGDIIILSTEYFLAEGNKRLQAQTMDINPLSKKYFLLGKNDTKEAESNSAIEKANQQIRFYVADCQRCSNGLFYKFIRDILTKFIATPYLRSNFSKEGDMVGHLNMPQPKLVIGKKLEIIDYSKEIGQINGFVNFARGRGASVYYVFPNHPQTAYDVSKGAIENFSSQMKSKLNCEIINTPETFLFPDKYYFDLLYHLNKEGRQKRTDIMIDLLKDKIF